MITLASSSNGNGSHRSFDVVIAIARQRLLDSHVNNAIALIERASGVVPAAEAFRLYCRLHRIEDELAAMLRHQLLVYVGRAVAEQSHWADGAVIECVRRWGKTLTRVERLRRRLGGRTNPDLRRWVGRHRGFVERELVDIHLGNLVELWESMGPSATEALVLDAYTDHVQVARMAIPILLDGLLGHGFERQEPHRAGFGRAAGPAAADVAPTGTLAHAGFFERRLRDVQAMVRPDPGLHDPVTATLP